MKLQLGLLKAETLQDILQANGLSTEGLILEKTVPAEGSVSNLKVSIEEGSFCTFFGTDSVVHLVQHWTEQTAFLLDRDPMILVPYSRTTGGGVTRAAAEKVRELLSEIEGGDLPSDENYGPRIYDADHQELKPGSWSIVWEGPEWDWPEALSSAWNTLKRVPGVFVEPINHYSVGIYWIGE